MTEDQERFTDGFSATVSAPETDPLVHSGKVELADFCAVPNDHVFIYLPCREPWPAATSTRASTSSHLILRSDQNASGAP